MRKNKVHIFLSFLLCCLLITACYKSPQRQLTPALKDNFGMVDSASFFREHHYWHNYNLRITADSLLIAEDYPEFTLKSDTFALPEGTNIVVADIIYVSSDTIDSVWVKVASDQFHQGWLREHDLLKGVVPDSPISSFIYYFSDSRLIVILSIFALSLLFYIVQRARRRKLLIVHFNDIDSPYPTMFCLTLALCATLYGSIQHFAPEQWEHFYFHPTLNPFALSPLLGIFIACVWLLIIIGIAVIEDLRLKSGVFDRLSYLMGLVCVSMALYLIFSLTVHYYIGYPLFACYALYAIISYFRRMRPKYVCGACGRKLPKMGECQYCGAMNQLTTDNGN